VGHNGRHFRSVCVGSPNNSHINNHHRRNFPLGVSNQMMSVVQSTIPTSISGSTPSIIGSTHPLSAAMSLPSTTNSFSFGMPSMSMQSILTGSQSLTQTSNIGVGSSSIPYQVVPWGGGHISPSFPSIGVGHSCLLALTLSQDGVVLWVVDFNP
jgi:hypothetical protein